MILTEDIQGYRVGDEFFQRGMSARVGFLTLPSQAYNQAWRRSQETGLPIITVGEDTPSQT